MKERPGLPEEEGLPTLRVAKPGEDSLSDIEPGGRRRPLAAVVNPAKGTGVGMSPGWFNMEAKLGLKKDMTDLLKRMGVSVKPTVGVTQGSDVADSYARMIDAEPILTRKINAMTFAEFGETAKQCKVRGPQKGEGVRPSWGGFDSPLPDVFRSLFKSLGLVE